MGECTERQEFDELVCASCGMRWGRDEERPPCPRVPEARAEGGGLIDRVLEALDLTVASAARKLKVPRSEIDALRRLSASQIGDGDFDRVFLGLSALVDYRTGRLLAARDELQAKLQRDRARRAARREAIENR